jgi:aminopeptidase
MQDPRLAKLAAVLVDHSTKLVPGEKVLIEAFDIPEEMVLALIRKVRQAGGVPQVSLKNNRVQRELIRMADVDTMKQSGSCEAHRMAQVQAYMGLRGSNNISELSDVPGPAMDLYEREWLKPVHYDIRVPKTKWVVLRWPTPAMAQQAQLSTEAFEDFYFDVCTLDYGRMSVAAQALKLRMEQTSRVRLTGVDTDLQFSIKGIPAVPCSGSRNIPDGECFTAPVRDSVNGTIRFNVPTIYRGSPFSDICLTFEKGKIVKAESSQSDKLNEILDTDEGARYIGEFAIGFNPFITKPMLDILFDEKIAGSFHFTPGQAYEEADNGNRSSVHWDMVFIQTPEYGGGKIYFDEVCIRSDGLFVVPDLEVLNPEQLK